MSHEKCPGRKEAGFPQHKREVRGAQGAWPCLPHGRHRGKQRMKGWKSHSPIPKQPRRYGEGGGSEEGHGGRAGLAAGGSALGWRGGAGQGPRGTRWGDPAQLPLPPPSLLPLPAGGQRGGPGGAGVPSPRLPPLPAGSRRTPPAPPRPARPPRALTLRAVVQAVELPVRGQGLQRHRRRPR